jgi:hypothetical protein
MPTDLATKERPILFNAEMVRAVLAGRKTQTRRVNDLPHFRPSNTKGYDWTWRGQAPVKSVRQQARHPGGCWQDVRHDRLLSLCPCGVPGDRLWVREAHAIVPRSAYAMSDGVQQILRPDDSHDAAVFREGWKLSPPSRWRPSIHMPRWASRILLEITDVRVERVQDISEEDVIAEGLYHHLNVVGHMKWYGRVRGDIRRTPNTFGCPQRAFADIWNSISAKPGQRWDDNPWVWAVTFKKLEVK